MDEFLVHELKAALFTSEAAVRAEWEAKLRKFVDSSGAGGAAIKTEVRVGHPYVELVEACHNHSADLLVMGDKEVEQGFVAVRSRKDGDLGTMTLADFRAKLLDEVATKAK